MPKPLTCPTCSAPLDPDELHVESTRCTYCGSVLLMPGVSDRGPGATASLDGSLLGLAVKLGEVARLVVSGSKIEAIKHYREATGVGLSEAKEAVERLGSGQPLTIFDARVQRSSAPPGPSADPRMAEVVRLAAIGRKIEAIQRYREITGAGLKDSKEAVERLVPAASSAPPAGRRAVLIAVVALVALVVGIGLVLAVSGVLVATSVGSPTVPTAPPRSPAIPPIPSSTPAADPAAPDFEFGSEGIGAGQFKDARTVTLDGEGRIYVGEYSGGRVQVFDRDGKFLRQWMVDPKAVLLALAADRSGTVYAVHPSGIVRYDGKSGERLGEVRSRDLNLGSPSDAYVALDGSLWVVAGRSKIAHLGARGNLLATIDAASRVGEEVDLERVAVDGTGTIYALSRRLGSVFKFAPDGRFLTRFGSTGDGTQQIYSPSHIAVDGRGRVYVSYPGRGIQVFDSDGRHVGSVGDGVIFGIAIADSGEIYATLRNDHTVGRYAPLGG